MDRSVSLLKFEAYLQRRFPKRRTSKDYLSDLRQFMAFCQKPWREVNMHDIDAFVDQQRQRDLKPATIKRRAAALKTFFDFLAEESGDLSWPNPVRMKRHAGKQPRQLPRDLSDEAVQRLWEGIDSRRDRAWFVLMLRAGLRVGEVVSLKLEDLLSPPQIDQPARIRVCGKGRKERVVLLTAEAYAVLQAWLQERPASEQPHLFLNEREGSPLSVSGIEFRLRQYGQQVGLAVTPHQLRHTYARQLTDAGMPLPSLGKLLGHSQISTTQIYTAGADPQLAQAYQRAMSTLAEVSPSQRLPGPEPPSETPPRPAPPVVEQTFQAPDWEAWAPELPEAIRQPIVAFVKRRLPSWKLRRRREQALKVLGEFQRFWRCQMANRPLQHPAELTLQDLWAYQTQRSAEQKAVRTADYTLGLVVSWLRELADQGGAVDASGRRWHPRPRPETLPRHLSEQEAQQLEGYVASRLGTTQALTRLENACFFLLSHTGLRAGECLDVCLQDLDLERRRLTVRRGKGQRDRVVYFSDTTYQALRNYLGSGHRPGTAPVFTRPDGRPISYMWLYEHITALGQAAAVESVTPHRLRHTLATRLLNAGMEISCIQKLLGHEQINTTMIYARVLDHTLETDYRQAMQKIEKHQMPLSNTPEAVVNWPTSSVKVPETLDNSV
jgi:site-specific recombinase XerD